MRTDTYRADVTDLTVYRTDKFGEVFDLGADGERITDTGALADFVRELHDQGAYDLATMYHMLGQINERIGE